MEGSEAGVQRKGGREGGGWEEKGYREGGNSKGWQTNFRPEVVSP